MDKLDPAAGQVANPVVPLLLQTPTLSAARDKHSPHGAAGRALSGLRILAFASEFPPYRGGIGTYAANLAAAAAELGATICVAAPDYGRTDHNDGRYPFEVIRFAGGQHSARDSIAKWRLARRLIGRGNWDVIHAIDWPFFIPISLAAPRDTRRLFMIHGSDVFDMVAPHRRAAIRLSRTFAGDFAVVGNSLFTANLFRKHFPAIPPDRVRHELLGVSPFWLEQPTRSTARQQALGLPEDAFVVTTVGRLTPRKGHLGVLKALDLLPDTLRSRIFHAIVGPSIEDHHSQRIDQAITASACSVRRFGSLSDTDLRDIYAHSDVFCLVGEPVSDRTVEGFGLVLLEAGGQRLPAIAGDIGGVAEVVEHERSGLIVPVSDPAAVAAALERLMEDPVLLRRLGAGAKATAERLSWQRCAAATYGSLSRTQE